MGECVEEGQFFNFMWCIKYKCQKIFSEVDYYNKKGNVCI